jgi:hypothetical protein
MRSVVIFSLLGFLLGNALWSRTPRGLTGTWVGTFNGQPEAGQNETVTRFELSVHQSGRSITGILNLPARPGKGSDIRKGVCDSEGCSFEVVDYGDGDTPQAWRVWIDGKGHVEGMRNRDPLAPIGVGAGARLFRIQAKRTRSN